MRRSAATCPDSCATSRRTRCSCSLRWRTAGRQASRSGSSGRWSARCHPSTSTFPCTRCALRRCPAARACGVGHARVMASALLACLPASCAGRALAVRWPCAGRALALRWPCAGRALAVRWPCAGLALALRWPCAGLALAPAAGLPGGTLCSLHPTGSARSGIRATIRSPQGQLVEVSYTDEGSQEPPAWWEAKIVSKKGPFCKVHFLCGSFPGECIGGLSARGTRQRSPPRL